MSPIPVLSFAAIITLLAAASSAYKIELKIADVPVAVSFRNNIFSQLVITMFI